MLKDILRQYPIEKFSSVLDASSDLIVITDADGNYLYVSAAAKHLIGYRPEEMIGKSYKDFIEDGDGVAAREMAANFAMKTTHQKENFNLLHKNGQIVSFLWNIRWNEEDEVFICIGRNISDTIKFQTKLLLNERRYTTLIESGFDFFAILGKDLSMLYIAPNNNNNLGYKPGFLTGRRAIDFIHPEDLPEVLAQMEQLQKPNSRIKLAPYRFQTAEEKWIYLETIAINKFHDQSVKGIVINSRDVTEKTRYVKALAESEEHYRFLFESSPLPMFAFATDTFQMVMVNTSALQQYGYTKKEFLKLSALDLRPKSEHQKFHSFKPQLGQDKPLLFAGDWVHLKKDGTLIDVEIISSRIVLNNVVCRIVIALDITEKSKAKQALEESKSLFATISENFPNGAILILDRDLRVEYIAGSELSKLKRQPEDYIGKIYPDFFHGETRETIYATLLSVFEKRSLVFEFTFRHLHYLVSAVVLKKGGSEDYLLLAIQNTTDQFNQLTQIHFQSNILQNVTNFILVTDNHFTVTYQNKQSHQFFSSIGGVRSGNKIFDLFPFKYHAALKEVFDQLKDDEFADVQMEVEGLQPIWISVRFSIMRDASNRNNGYLCVGENITNKKRIEKEKEILIQELNSTVKDLKQFSYITSHNLRSPIANLLGITNIIETEKVEDDFTRLLLEKVRESTNLLNDTVTDLMDVLLIKNNVNIEKESISLSQTWQEVVTSVENIVVESNAKIVVDLGDADTIVFKKTYLESILLNLLTNSIKYRSPQRQLMIHLKTEKRDGYVVLYFMDNGLGINLSRHGNKVFGLYQKFHNHPDSKGLGLYLINSQIRAMGGKIEIESEENKGTTFTISFKD